MRRFLILALTAGLPTTLHTQAASVILVRHAEKAAPSGDVDISAIGQARAAALAEALTRYPLQGIFVSQYKRTLQTALPVATRVGLAPVAVPVTSGDVRTQATATAAAIRALPAGSAALVVGHSNTLGPTIEALGGPHLDDLCDGEYATMFVLELPANGAPRLLRTSFGVADAVDALACHAAGPPGAAADLERAAVLATVRGFHDALRTGDSLAALRFLAPDVRVLEAGEIEAFDEYRRGHLAADIAFTQAVPSTSSEPIVTVDGGAAWVSSTSRTTGTFRGRSIDSMGAELMVLARTPAGWRIRAIHWSSRNVRPPAPPAN